jgi:hypothetical protein
MAKVGLATKFLSNRNYIKEVSVEGKRTNKFNFSIGFYDQYAAQIIRIGNCITLLSNDITINKETFWNPNYFEDLTKYVFWTFNQSFLFTLTETSNTLTPSTLNTCFDLLQKNFTPYDAALPDGADEELQWCLVKNEHLKKDPKFGQMYSLDKENRSALLEALATKINPFKNEAVESGSNNNELFSSESKTTSFLDVVKPLTNDPTETLNFIASKLEEAKFDLNLLSKIDKLPNGKNPYGLNGAIAAMIDFFYQHNYFKKEYTLEEIFKAYSAYSGNSIAKLKTFLSEFRQDNSYIKHFEKLKQLKISKLK